jgi:hypothetical protein
MGAKLTEQVGGVHQPTLRDVDVRLRESRVQGGAVSVVQPISRIKRQEFDFCPLGEGSWFIEHQASVVDPSFDRHEGRLTSDLPPNKPLQPTSGAKIRVE